ncbi:hypothetical protein cyc_04492 [Cyclospora cayetanensis]|uniref:Transmembrane protein n=1 Tax=Cyclospora cayetanensis TaxID=88456 RepID=A0A1D3D2P4_9EIME|nr:hypothetical protein cyc_04492 [Cyclospora cayetanensis]
MRGASSFLVPLCVLCLGAASWLSHVSPVCATVELSDKLKTALGSIFSQDNDENPSPKLEDLKLSDDLPTNEKVEAVVGSVASFAGVDVSDVLEEADLLEKVKDVLQEKDTNHRRSHLLELLKELFQKLAAKLTGKKSCKELKAEGHTPEARLGYSPVRFFGYPHYDTETQQTYLYSGVPLNIVNGFKQPIKVGRADYLVQGPPSKVLAFFDCFGEYTAIAQALTPDGHWISSPHDGMTPRPLYLQVQGTTYNGTVAQILVRAALKTVVKQIDFKFQKRGMLTEFVEKALSGNLEASDFVLDATGARAIKDLWGYTRLSKDDLVSLVAEMSDTQSIPEKLKLLYKYMNGTEIKTTKWSHRKLVKKQRSIMVTLTTYPKPDAGVRSTRQMDSPKVTLQDISDALKEIDFEY